MSPAGDGHDDEVGAKWQATWDLAEKTEELCEPGLAGPAWNDEGQVAVLLVLELEKDWEYHSPGWKQIRVQSVPAEGHGVYLVGQFVWEGAHERRETVVEVGSHKVDGRASPE